MVEKHMRKNLLIILAISIWFLGIVFIAMLRAEAVPNFNKITDAIYLVEGGKLAKKPFGVLSVPCYDYETCRRIAHNTVVKNFKRWQDAGEPGEYLEFLSKRYAPMGAENDSQNLNRNWLKNVRYFLEKNEKKPSY